MTDAATPKPAAPDRAAALAEAPVVLSVRDLEVQFRTEDGWLTAIDGLSYDLRRGETLGIVGESGSGKSVTNLAVMRLLPIPPARIPRGKILFHGQDLLELSPEAMRKIRGHKISMIFQDPMSSLNPFLRISKQLAEVLAIHQGITGSEAKARVIEMLARVGIPDAERRYDHYPHQFSGGMRQRVMIAMMLLNTPELLIADEPTTALDVTIQAQILDLLGDLQRQFEMAITLITHDLGVVAGMSDRVIVMYSGKVMESATADDLFALPSHPYTLGLLRSLPRLDQAGTGALYSIPGRPPDLNNRPPGCPFAPRCEFVRAECRTTMPPQVEVSPDHRVACFATDEVRELVATGRHLEVAR
ncbi:MAG: ABC transporter ATP-binding protein [Deltaproteobacteria bacterium]|nr:ABC transporter ATP-binding protein [Deltaproteobacteria bacterium]MCB9785490.1 ABC transporter ATP-binding protein [Deltaproteobacteria bacterium]